MFREFRAFLLRGTIIDLAVAVIIGVAFGAVVTSLVENIITPIIGAVFGKQDFSALTFTIKAASGGGGGATAPLPNGMQGMIALVMAMAVILIGRKKSGRPGSLTNTF